MPILQLPTGEYERTIIRPSVIQVLKQLQDYVGFPEDLHVYYPRGDEGIPEKAALLTGSRNDSTTSQSPKIIVAVEESITTETLVDREVQKPFLPPILQDEQLDVFVKLGMILKTITLRCEAKFADKASAMQWRTIMANQCTATDTLYIHHTFYHIYMPPPLVALLRDIHAMRENVAGYGDTLGEWIKSCVPANTTNAFTILTDQASDKRVLAWKQHQDEIQGRFDFDDLPEKGERTDDGETWHASFTYTFKMDVADTVIIEYPYMVHNQPLDAKWNPIDLRRDLDNPSYQRNAGYEALLAATSYTTMPIRQKRTGVSIPSYDDFAPKYKPKGTIRLATCMIEQDTANLGYMLTLTDIPGLDLPDFVWEFIQTSEYPFMGFMHQSLFQVQIYQKRYFINQKKVHVDAMTNVTHDHPDITLRDNLHVRFGIYYDLSELDEKALERLRDHGKVLDWWTKYILKKPNWDYKDHGIGDDHHLIPMDDVYALMGRGYSRVPSTVETFYITTYRNDQL